MLAQIITYSTLALCAIWLVGFANESRMQEKEARVTRSGNDA
jgi:hypothetical protein